MKSIMLFLLFLTCYFNAISQQPGMLDDEFGDNGKLINNDFLFKSCGAIIVKDNGKILASGYGKNTHGDEGTLLAQYDKDGSLDIKFGDSGRAIAISPFNQVFNIIVQTDNKIITTGTKNGLARLVRFNENGTVDTEFGDNGEVNTSISPEQGLASAIYDAALQKDGKIVTTGWGINHSSGNSSSFIARYLNDGTLDNSFGDGGILLNTFQNLTYLNSLVLQRDGKILVSGLEDISKNQNFLLARYMSDGTPDKTFGKNAIAHVFLTDKNCTAAGGADIKLTTTGQIVLAGTADTNKLHTYKIAIARLNNDGSIDNNFGVNGSYVTNDIKFESVANTLMLQNDGKLLVAGSSSGAESVEKNYTFLLRRFSAEGVIDSSFGENGIAGTGFNSYQNNATCAALQRDGKILLGGSLFDKDFNETTAFVRFIGDPVKQPNPIAKKIRRWIRNHTLQWQPVNDNNVAYYSIQQSGNSVNGFKEIGRIANVNRQSSNVNNVYSYNLNNTSAQSLQLKAQSPTNYYRITAISNNGSNITSDAIADESASSITISPNPVKDVMKISGLPSGVKSTINIINRNGNVLQTAISNSSTYNMNITQLKSGLYSVQVVSNSQMQTVKFVKE